MNKKVITPRHPVVMYLVTMTIVTVFTTKHMYVYALDSEDDFRLGCRNVCHQQQYFPEVLSPGRSQHMNYVFFC